MQNLVRYNVINQDGQPVIRVVPVARPQRDAFAGVVTRGGAMSEPITEQEIAQPQPILRRIRRPRHGESR